MTKQISVQFIVLFSTVENRKRAAKPFNATFLFVRNDDRSNFICADVRSVALSAHHLTGAEDLANAKIAHQDTRFAPPVTNPLD